jgi:hypothetical protein
LPVPAGEAIAAASATTDGEGIVAITTRGTVVDSTGTRKGRSIANAAAITVGGTWVASTNGAVVNSRGMTVLDVGAPVGALAASQTGDGFWVVDRDGKVATFGDAKAAGDATVPPVPPEVEARVGKAMTPPVVAMAAAPNGGYWIVRDNGKVYALGGAPQFGGTSTLALFTQ